MFKPTFWQSFTLQTSLSFALLVLITALAVGLPTAWLLKRQTEQHIRDLLVQSTTTTQTLLANRQTNLQNLALLTAQRPTLTILLQANNQKALEDYLTTLQGGAGVDAVVICDAQRIVAQTSPVLTACPGTTDQLFYSNHAATVWLFASEIITLPARVLVGYRLDADFLRTIGQESGLALFLWQTQQLLAHSVAELPPSPNVAEFIVQGTRYRSHTVTLLGSVTESNLQLQIALPINTLMANQQQLNRWLGGLLVIVISSGLLFGAGLSQRINRPLGQLYTAAVTMRQGNLAQPIQVKSNLQEVIQVAQALDETRTALQHSLSELQNQKEWHDHLLAGIVEGIITLDAKHKITFFSQGAEKITACSASQALGHHCNEILRLENTNQLFSQHLPAIGQTKKIPIWLQEHSVTLAISASQFLLPNTDVTQTVLVLRDISEAEILPRLLGNFLANIAHEFRTPLSALSASVELLNEQHEQLSPSELRELLTALHLGTLSLQTLIDNLLEGASIETGQFRVSAHPAQLTDIINTVCSPSSHFLKNITKRFSLNARTGYQM
jgi:signal transduction histidine kinase